MPETATVPKSDFAPLVQEVRAAGLLDRRFLRYTVTVGLDLLLYGAAFALLVLVGDSWWQLALAVPAAVLTTRLYFVGHDAGHGQIASTRRMNKLMGLLIGNLGLGLGYGWWTDKHNRHHANPNHVDKDPDVGVGVLVWTAEQAADREGAFTRWLTRNQGRMFFPLLLLEGFNLKVSSVQSVIAAARGRCGARQRRMALVEMVLLTLHFVGYLALVFSVMSPGKALAFIFVHQAVLGVHLGCAFAPNHKGMPMPGPDERWDHLRKQVLTSRNVRGGLLTDWFLGGLNYQIEHHLFPSMPRPNLRRAQPLVREHCARLDLPYTEEGLIESYAHALGHLQDVGAPLR
jgi:fatty acid desaturase